MTEISDISRDKPDIFDAWLVEAKKGERLIYWVGPSCGGAHRKTVSDLVESGHVFGFIQRNNKHTFRYMVQRSSKRLSKK